MSQATRSTSSPGSGWPGAWAEPAGTRRRRLLWSLLVVLLVVGQTLLVVLTLRYEESRAQDRVDDVAAAAVQQIKRLTVQRIRSIQTDLVGVTDMQAWTQAATRLLRQERDLARLELRNAEGRLVSAVDSPGALGASTRAERADRTGMRPETGQACALARQVASPQLSRSYFVPLPGGMGLEVTDVCMAETASPDDAGYVVATLLLGVLLEEALPAEQHSRYELSFVDSDNTRLARYGASRGLGVFVGRRVVDLPGYALELKVDDTEGRPGLIPTLTTALVLGLSILLSLVVALLLRDMRRRVQAERALAESLAFRKAMEDSLITGLRARDLDGRITYVNPAFCNMVGHSAAALLSHGGQDAEDPPYWPPERVQEYRARQSSRHQQALQNSAGASLEGEAQQGFERVFMRANGERFPVMIFEAPMLDGSGRQTGWMSAVLDMSEQERSEERLRQQQERLQATARLATLGEMASLLSHELNQPLAAIASYAHGSLNMLDEPDQHTLPMLREALRKVAEQAERAGRVIRSVHDFVRRREQTRESVEVSALIQGVLPLMRLQARKSGTRIDVVLADPRARVVVDRTMLEQVLLNLSRNGIQAMEVDTPLADRVLTLRTLPAEGQRLLMEVCDRGPGISEEVAEQLCTPFFTTRQEGMGLGLSLCRTVVEQHGGTLEHGPGSVESEGTARGCCFRFTLPVGPEGRPVS